MHAPAISVRFVLVLVLAHTAGLPASGAQAASAGVARHTESTPPLDGTQGASGPPVNFRAGVFQSLVQQMWRSSPTFRRQCERLAGAPGMTVTVRAEAPRTGAPLRAFTRLSDTRAGATAQMVIWSAGEAIELIAHELEHIIEHLDGADRTVDTCGRRHSGGPHKSYETCRAIEAGRRVAREVTSVAGPRVRTIRQQETMSGPLDPPTARVSPDGGFVVFTSAAGLLPGARPGSRELYVVDLHTGALHLESVRPGWPDVYDDFRHPGISAGGRVLVFEARDAAEARRGGFGWEVVVLDRRSGHARVVRVGADDRTMARTSAPVISADGATVAFESIAWQASGPPPGTVVYIARLDSGDVERVDPPDTVPAPHPRGASVPAKSMTPAISADGRYVAYATTRHVPCANPVACATATAGAMATIQVYDTVQRVTTRIVRGINGREPNGASYRPSISADGRYVAFTSEASNLVVGDRNGVADVFLYDTLTGATDLVSRRSDGRPGNGASGTPAVSADGSIVAFQSVASDLICHRRCAPRDRDTNLLPDVFVLDRRTGAVRRASAGRDGEWMAPSRSPSIDDTGHVLAFSSRHPVGDDDLMNDEDLYIQLRPAAEAALPVAIRAHDLGRRCLASAAGRLRTLRND
jgi:Tol biopolymer transport system component